MRLGILLIYMCVAFTVHSQFHDERVDPIVNLSFGYYPIMLKGIGDRGNGNSQDGIPLEPHYTSMETRALAGNVMVQLGADLNILLERKQRAGIRPLAGIGLQSGLKNADGLDGLAIEAGGQGFYRLIFDDIELAGLLGYKRYWSVLDYHFINLGIEVDFMENWGIMLSTSLNKYRYYRQFTNGFEEPAFATREFAVAFVYRY